MWEIGLQPCPNRFRSKQSPTKKESCTWQSIKKLSFYKTTTNTDKENLTFTVDFEKHSNSIDRCTVWPSDPISDYWRRPTNITNFHWCKFVGWSTRFRGTIHLKEGTAAPILIFFEQKNTIGQDELIISRNHD
jgi:hypothetical protein